MANGILKHSKTQILRSWAFFHNKWFDNENSIKFRKVALTMTGGLDAKCEVVINLQ